jgi:hypothetical protein
MSEATRTWGEWPEGGDPIGTASARLLALGIERMARLAALRFLGLLIDHADDEGHVHFDPDALASEFLVRREDARQYLSWLEDTDVVVAEHTGLLVRGAAGRPSPGLREGEAMAVLTEVLSAERAERAEHAERTEQGVEGREERVPIRQPIRAPLPDLPRVHLESRPEPARRRPVMAGAAILAGLVLVVAGIFARPSSRPDTEQIAADGDVPSTVVGPSAPGAGAVSSEEDTPAGSQDAQPSAGPAPVAEPATSDGRDEVAAGSFCPAELPSVGQIETIVVPASQEVAGGLTVPAWRIVVRGAVTGGDAEATITALAVHVTIAGEALAAPIFTSPLTVDAGEVKGWETVVNAGTTAPEGVAATAELAEWRWTDADLASACG